MTTHSIQSSGRQRKQPKAGTGFSLLDGRQIDRIAELPAPLESTAAYLALAVSTDAKNSETRGGRKSIQTYAGLSRGAADRAVAALEEAGIIVRLPLENIRNPRAVRFILPPAEAATPQSAPFAVPNSFSYSRRGTSPLTKLVAQGDFGPLALALHLMRQNTDTETDCLPFAQIHRKLTYVCGNSLGALRLHRFAPSDDGATIQDTRISGAREDLAILEALRIVEWAVYAARPGAGGKALVTSIPLGVLRHGSPVIDCPEGSLGILGHLLVELHAGRSPDTVGELMKAWKAARSFTFIAPAPSKVTGAVALLRLRHQVDPTGLQADERRCRCRRNAEDLVDLVAEFFPDATGLAEAALEAE